MSNEQRAENKEKYGSIKKESKAQFAKCRTLQIPNSAPCSLLSVSNKNVSFHFIVNCCKLYPFYYAITGVLVAPNDTTEKRFLSPLQTL